MKIAAQTFASHVLRRSQVDEMTTMMAKVFYRTEPLFYKMSLEDLHESYYKLQINCVDTSSVVIDTKTKEIVAGGLSCDFYDDINDKTTEYPKSLDPILELMEQVLDNYLINQNISLETLEQREILYSIFTGTKEEYWGKGLGKLVMNHNVALAKVLGYRQIRGDFTSEKSFAVGLKNGYKLIQEVMYDQIVTKSNPSKYWADVPTVFGEKKYYVGYCDLQDIDLKVILKQKATQ